MATITINTNLASLTAQRNLSQATTGMNTAMERLTTGYRINSGKDDAAGAAVSNLMEAQISAYDVAESNATMGLTLLDTAEGVLDIVGDYVQRIRDLTEQAANGTYSDDSRAAIKAEIESRLAEIDRIAGSAEYNGMLLMTGATGEVSIQVGVDGSDNSKVKLTDALFSDAKASTILGKANATMATNCSGAATAAGELATIDAAIDNISNRVTTLGASQNRLESAIDSIQVTTENLTSSLSTVKDADIATESTRYLQAQILQSAATTLLSTANQTPSIALQLI